MSLDKNKAIERSVDSVARIYAIIIGLALSEAIKTLIIKDPAGNVTLTWPMFLSGAPAFFAFLFTLVPFWHGMNRHLDRAYLEKETGEVVEGALLFDFGVFFVEASILLIAAWALRQGLVTFYCLGTIFLIDVLWGGLSHQLHFRGQKSHAISWASINIGAILLMIGVITFRFDPKTPILMAIAITRTIVDYWNGRDFYFPKLFASQGQP